MKDKGEIRDYAANVAGTDWDDFLQESRENPAARSTPVAPTLFSKQQARSLIPVCLFLAVINGKHYTSQ